MSNLFAFDFDGVVVDSARETGLAAHKTLTELKLDIGAERDVDEVLGAFVRARPVLETGWEAVLMLWLIAVEGATADDLLRDFQATGKDHALARIGRSQDDIMAAFHQARQAWIRADRAGWLAAHKFYDATVAAVKELVRRGDRVYIITTKSAEFAVELLAHAGIAIPPENIYGLGSGKKHDVLAQVLSHTGAASAVFVEDRLKTLEQVQQCGTADVKRCTRLLLAAWGYNTEDHRKAAVDAGIEVVAADQITAAHLTSK